MKNEQDFQRWFKALALADPSVSEVIIEGSGAMVKTKSGYTFEINIANCYKSKA